MPTTPNQPLIVPAPAGGFDAVLREGRQRFVAGFPKRCDSIELLLRTIAARGPHGVLAALREVAHQVAGMAGTVGFDAVSAIAGELEILAAHPDGSFDGQAARKLADALHATFAAELATPPAWAAPTRTATTPARILVVEDEEEQREIFAGCLRAAGHEAIAIAAGEGVVDAARAERPSLILLDANLPCLDGYSVCRLLKSDPDLARIPVIFVTVRASLDDRMAGLTLGADEYLVKPVDIPELLLRIELTLRRTRPAGSVEPRTLEQGQLLNYDEFVKQARNTVQRSAASFALVRSSERDADTVVSALRVLVRQRDIVSRYDQRHAVLLLAGAPPALLRHRIVGMVERLEAADIHSVFAGISFSTAPAEKTVETLLTEADDALAEARYLGDAAAVKSDRPRGGVPAAPTTLVLAEDDPDVTGILEGHFRAAGYRTIVVFNGDEALNAVRTHQPDVLLLELMMAGLSSFDVLARLHKIADRQPKVVILAPRGHEDEVTRAFELGADDYVTKPFSPRELMARVARLLR
jgi:DNA-binding response OmpR family regulator